jgi:hypothetical protein
MTRNSFARAFAALALLLAASGVAPGCAAPARVQRLRPSVFQAARLAAAPAGRARPAAAPDEGAALVVRGLRKAGLRFGTDGSTRALWGYMRTSHRLVEAADARPGDVLFFDTRGREGRDPECADHAGIVEAVDAGGRITFVEARGGELRQSFLDPERPSLRRDPGGQILNSFLRAKRIDDPAGTRYFAGEMLCGVARPKLR